MRTLADAIGEGPLTVSTCHHLRLAQARAWTIGSPRAFTAAVVQWHGLPGEPEAYGDPQAIWDILQNVRAWERVNVPSDVAPVLTDIVAAETHHPVTVQAELHHELRRCVAAYSHPNVRRLLPGDLAQVHHSAGRLSPDGVRELAAAVLQGILAAAIVDGQIVSIAHTSARSGGFASVGVETAEAFRRRGFATAAASLVVQAIRERGEVPVWATRETNTPSLRIAARLGFTPCGRKTFVVRTAASAEAAA